MIRLVLFLLLALAFSPVGVSAFDDSKDNVFIGNSGSGVLEHGRVYVRDLYDAGVAKSPWFGPSASALIPLMPEIGIEYSKELLARKIGDLNSSWPGFGDYILIAMQRYRWVLIEQELNLIEIRTAVKLPPGAKPVQLANRLKNVIRISKPAWELLNDEHRIALIVHEMVFSLLKPQKTANGFFEQSNLMAQEITGSFFVMPDFNRRGKPRYCETGISQLNVPGCLSWDDRRQALTIATILRTGAKSDRLYVDFESGDLERFEGFWRKVCSPLEITAAEEIVLLVVGLRLGLRAVDVPYASDSTSSQIAIKIERVKEEFSARLVFKNDRWLQAACLAAIPTQGLDFFKNR